MSYAFYHKLYAQPTTCPTNGITIVVGNCRNIAYIGFEIFIVFFNDMWLFYDFGVVKNLSLDVEIKSKFMRYHNAQLKYLYFGENLIEHKTECAKCIMKKHLVRGLADKQLRLHNSTARFCRQRNRFRRIRAC